MMMKQLSSRRRCNYASKKQQGYLLVESMVAITIFSIALVSLAGAQLTTSKSTLSAALKTESTVASSQIIDSMRTNLPAVLAGDYAIDFGDILTEPSDRDAASQAELDLYDWFEDLRDTKLKGASAGGQIACAGLACTVSIRWRDDRAGKSFTNSDADIQYTHTTAVTL